MRTIRELRTGRGWTQLELAYELGVTPATVSNWERGVFDPKAAQLRAIARLFGVSMDEVAFGGDGPAGEGTPAAEVTPSPARPGGGAPPGDRPEAVPS